MNLFIIVNIAINIIVIFVFTCISVSKILEFLSKKLD